MRELTVLLLTLLGLALGGCAVEDASRLSGPPLQFDDLTVPDGLKLQTSRNESYSRQTPAERIGHFVYYGTLPPQAVRDHMAGQMPLRGWRLVDESVSGQDAVLTFEKHPDAAVCRIIDGDGVSRMIVDIRTKKP